MANLLSRQNIRQASIIIAVLTVSSQFFGVFREMILANFFGTSAEYDILLLALSIPLMFTNILLMSISSAGIPYLQDAGQSMHNKGLFKTRFFTVNNVLALIITLIVFISLPSALKLLKGNLGEHEVDAVIKYGRIFCLLIPFKAYESVFRSLLHLKRHFIFPAMTNLIFNILSIIIMLLLFPSLSSWAFILAWLIGSFVQTLLVMIPSFYIYKPSVQSTSSDNFATTSYVKYLSMILIIEGLGLCLPPFDRYLCGLYLNAGYISAINYADAINSVPFRVFIISLGTAIFPALTEKASNKDKDGMSRLYHKSVAVCLAIILPLAVFFIIFKNEIVKILFERGRFDAFSRMITVDILSYLLVGLLFMSLFFIQARVLYAFKLWRSLILVKCIALILKVIFGFWFIAKDWALAIGGGTLIMYVSSFFMVEMFLYFRLKIKYSSADLALLSKSLLSSLIVSILLLAAYFLLRNVLMTYAVMFVVGILGFGAWVFFDQIFHISGIDLGRLIVRKSQ